MSASHGAAVASTGARWSYPLARVFLRTVGRLSDGLSLCFDEGLTSGLMLDYIYRNHPSGRLGIGRWMDAQFLSAPGWQAVRERRALLERALERAIAAQRAAGRPVVLVDIASGPADYVLAVLGRAGTDVVARCRDLDERWLQRGRERAAALGIHNVVFERGDALDRDALLAIRPRPNVVVASGFYDWIVDDQVVQRSIARVHEMLEPGGEFALTHQTDNPSLPFLNAVFTDFDHAPLTMRMRDVDTFSGWLTGAGFVIEEVERDARGCYGVVRARKD